MEVSDDNSNAVNDKAMCWTNLCERIHCI